MNPLLRRFLWSRGRNTELSRSAEHWLRVAIAVGAVALFVGMLAFGVR